MKTAVLMATYNGEKLLKDQLDSIKSQTLPPDYVIFRDDCSTDNTVIFLKNYIQANDLKNWIINVNEVNLGFQNNFRQLLIDSQKLSDIDYVFFSDQDDIWNLEKNYRQYSVAIRNPNIEVLSGDVSVVKLTSGAQTTTYYEFSDSMNEISQYPKRFTYKNYRLGWTLMLKPTIISDVLKYLKDTYYIPHDTLFTVLSSLLETGYNLNEIVGYYNRHDNNASGKPNLTIRSPKSKHLLELQKVLGFYTVLYHVLNDRNSENKNKIEDLKNFYQKRYDLSLRNKTLSTLMQIITDWKYYENMPNRIRDIIFAFKKGEKNES